MFKLNINSCDGIYHDSLDVRFTKACDNACAFCIERGGIESLGATDVPAMVAATLSSGRGTVLILGGEPFLSPVKLRAYVEGIAPGVREIFVTTSVPPTLDLDDPDVAAILSKLTGLNTSVHHWQSARNNEILRASRPFDRIARLGELLSDEALAPRIRVCSNLVRGALDSQDSVRAHLDAMSALGAREIKLNELQHVGRDSFISLEEVFGLRMPSPYAHGCQTDISDLFSYPRMRVLLKRACYRVSPVERASFDDLAKVLARRIRPAVYGQRVLYENGQLEDGWLSGGVRLLPVHSDPAELGVDPALERTAQALGRGRD